MTTAIQYIGRSKCAKAYLYTVEEFNPRGNNWTIRISCNDMETAQRFAASLVEDGHAVRIVLEDM